MSARDGSKTVEILLPNVEIFDLELTLLLDPSATPAELTNLEFVVDEADEDALIEIVERSAGSVRVNVGPLTEPRVLVFNESYCPGWTASVDQASAAILRANDAFMAIPLDAGSHEVIFRFQPYRVRIGIVVSILTFAVSILGFLILSFARRNLFRT